MFKFFKRNTQTTRSNPFSYRNLLVCSIFLLASAASAFAHDGVLSVIPLDHILDDYSKRNGTKFVVDPRVKAKVKTSGISVSDIDKSMLIGILTIHGFIATEKDDVVYVLPMAVADRLGLEIGEKWIDS